MRKSNEQSLKEAINSLLEAYHLKEKMNELELVSCWAKIMGKSVAGKTREITIRKKKLYIKLDSAPLRHELMMHKQQIIDLLNEHFHEEVVNEVILS